MKLSTRGLLLIKEFEGFSAHIYADAAGLPTIGYGHLIRKNEYFPSKIDALQAEALLRQDVIQAEKSLLRLTRRNLRQTQFDALTSFVFNLGGAAFQRSTLRQKVNHCYDDEVPEELMRWVWAGGRKLPGLIRRRQAEAELYGAAG